MRDAFGGIVNIAIIVVFISIVSGFLAFNVGYTKAYRLKNYIIDELEKYGNMNNVYVRDDINKYMRYLGYNASTFDITGYTCQKGYCVKRIDSANNSSGSRGYYYSVITQVNIDIPIVNKVLPFLKVFRVTGNTRTIFEH